MCEPHLNLHYHFRMILPRPLTDDVRQRRLVLSLEGLYLAQSRFGSITKAREKTWVNSGPDWARTSDPALIKRML